MRVAPPADFPVARRGPWAVAAAGLAMSAVAALGAWMISHDLGLAAHLEGRLLVPAAMVTASASVVAGVWAWRRVATVPPSLLRWDGAGWHLRHLHTPGGPGRLIALDRLRVELRLARFMLLSARTVMGERLWLLIQRGDDESGWHGLQVALRQPAPSGPSARTTAPEGLA